MASPTLAAHPDPTSDQLLLHDLEENAEQLLERHLSRSKEWFPHEHVPWSEGRNFEPGERVGNDALPEAVRSALVVNLLTEDNLPYYTQSINEVTGPDGAWGTWLRRWTAEEGRHSIAIRDWLCVTRQVDLIELEQARMAQVCHGFKLAESVGVADLLVYVALQELATRISHRNTGALIDDAAGKDVMARVATDENHHFLFYRDLVTAAIEKHPSILMPAIERQVRTFEMPGTGMPSFKEHAHRIADAGIYDVPIHHAQILEPVVLREWRIAAVERLDGAAEAARDRLVDAIAKFGRIAERVRQRRARLAAN